MFFEDINQIPQIASQTSCAVFVIDPHTNLNLRFALTLSPATDKKTSIISVEQVREFIALSSNKESSDRYYIIAPADAMNEAAQNAFLKTLEEPKPHCHFILLTEQPAALLPTILSRVQVYFLRRQDSLKDAPTASTKVMTYAKKLISASSRDLPALATELSKIKSQPREFATDVTATAIELLYKSYFKTKNPKFLSKISNFISLHDALSQNGHIKLQIIANLL